MAHTEPLGDDIAHRARATDTQPDQEGHAATVVRSRGAVEGRPRRADDEGDPLVAQGAQQLMPAACGLSD